MTDTAKQHPASVTHLGTQRARRSARLAVQVDELEDVLAGYVERERVHELEIQALRRDLDLKAIHNVMLDRDVLDQRRHGEWLQTRLDAEAEAHRSACSHAAHLQELLDSARAELAAERSRTSYRIVARVLAAFDRHPKLLAILLRITRRSADTSR
jgi:hypothetical protein